MIVETGKQKLVKEVIKAAEEGLVSLGMVKRRSMYVLPLKKHTLGIAGFAIAFRRGDCKVGISPVVGVRQEQIESALEKLLKGTPRLNYTLSTPVGYLTPQARYLEWIFEPFPFDYRDECRKMVEAIEIYGVPFMTSNSSFDGIMENLAQTKFTTKEAAAYRLPIGYVLAGRVREAEDLVQDQLQALGTRNDIAAAEYRNFAERLLQELMAGAPHLTDT